MPLPEIPGQKIQNFQRELERETVLEYYDGPRLILQQDSAGTLHLAVWNDSSPEQERWLLLEIGRDRLIQVLQGEIPLREALENPQNGRIVVMDEDQNGQLTATITTLAQMPQDSLPMPGIKLSIPMHLLPGAGED